MNQDRTARETASGSLGDETRLLRWGSLLYSAFWFAEPIQRRSITVWVVFLAFYGTFLTGYFRVLRGGRREQRTWPIVLPAWLSLLSF